MLNAGTVLLLNISTLHNYIVLDLLLFLSCWKSCSFLLKNMLWEKFILMALLKYSLSNL